MNADHTQRIAELARERIEIVPYDRTWPERYGREEGRLRSALPQDLVQRIAHIGSTAVPGLSAKPIIDVQVEVSSLERARQEVIAVMEDLGYEFIWRPSIGEAMPYYAWFILRDPQGARSHHVHMVEPDAASEERILFRDFLRANAEEARLYEQLKTSMASIHATDRWAYAASKTDFIHSVLQRARATREP